MSHVTYNELWTDAMQSLQEVVFNEVPEVPAGKVKQNKTKKKTKAGKILTCDEGNKNNNNNSDLDCGVSFGLYFYWLVIGSRFSPPPSFVRSFVRSFFLSFLFLIIKKQKQKQISPCPL